MEYDKEKVPIKNFVWYSLHLNFSYNVTLISFEIVFIL